MAPTPPLPEPLWKAAPPDLQAAILALVQVYEQRITQLESRINDLENRLKLNSTNSSKPPSSDPIGMKRRPPAPPTGKKRGGQRGHRKAKRALVPPEKVRETIHCKPSTCRRCGSGLAGDDPEPLIHQVAELPKIEPIVDEYRLHRLACPDCGETTCGTLPTGVPRGCFRSMLRRPCWPCLQVYRLSKRARQVQQLASDSANPSISGTRDDLQSWSGGRRKSLRAVQRTGGFDPPCGGAQHRRDVVAGKPTQGLAVGHRDQVGNGLHHCRSSLR